MNVNSEKNVYVNITTKTTKIHKINLYENLKPVKQQNISIHTHIMCININLFVVFAFIFVFINKMEFFK